MALINIEDYSGSITGNAVIETLQIVGLVDALRRRGYSINITGIQEPTPKGYIDDEPKSHEISVSKVMFIGNREDIPYIKDLRIDEESDLYKEEMKRLRMEDLEFGATLGVPREEKRHITVDKHGVWYRHTLNITLEQGSKTDQEYVKSMFETIAEMIVMPN